MLAAAGDIHNCSRQHVHKNLTISLTLTLRAIVDVAPAAANTICVGLLSQYAAPFDVAGSLPTPDSISEFFPHLRKVFSRDAGLAELYNRSQNLTIFDFKKCDLEMGSKVTHSH